MTPLFQQRTLILVIGTTSLDGVLTRGGCVLAEATQQVPSDDLRSAWESGLDSLDGPLNELISRVGCRRGDRVVVIGRPSAGSTVYREGSRGDSLLVRSNELEAVHACSGFEPSSLMTQSWTWNSGQRGDVQESVLSGSVPDSVLVDCSDWVSRAGLRFEGFVPIQMWETAKTIREAERCEYGTVCCRIGPECTVLAIRTPEKGIVVRAIEFGVQVLASVYSRSASNRGFSCDHDEAWRLLSQQGVQWTSKEDMGEIAQDALPMLAPVLQRFNIELKQTLRYHFGAESKSKRLRCAGIGHRVPGLCDAIAENLELMLDLPAEEAEPITGSPAQSRQLDAATIRELCSLQLFLPRQVARQRKLRRSAIIAAQSGVIAAAMVVGEHQILTIQSNNTSAILVDLEEQIAIHDISAVKGKKIAQDKASTLDQLSVFGEIYGQAPHWPGVMRELIEQDRVVVQSVRVTVGDHAVKAVVGGWLPLSLGESALRERMVEWRDSGIVRQVEPTSLVRFTENDLELLRFTLEFDLERFPVWFHHPELAAMIETGATDGEP